MNKRNIYSKQKSEIEQEALIKIVGTLVSHKKEDHTVAFIENHDHPIKVSVVNEDALQRLDLGEKVMVIGVLSGNTDCSSLSINGLISETNEANCCDINIVGRLNKECTRIRMTNTSDDFEISVNLPEMLPTVKRIWSKDGIYRFYGNLSFNKDEMVVQVNEMRQFQSMDQHYNLGIKML